MLKRMSKSKARIRESSRPAITVGKRSKRYLTERGFYELDVIKRKIVVDYLGEIRRPENWMLTLPIVSKHNYPDILH